MTIPLVVYNATTMEHGLNIAILLVLLAQTGLIVVLAALFVTKAAVINAQLVAFVSPVSEGAPSPLATIVETTADMFSRSMMASAKMTFAGLSSGAVRQEAAIAGDIAVDMATMNPVIEGLLSSFPSLKKTLRKNPALLDLAVAKLTEKIGSGPGPGPGPTQSQMPLSGSKINR